MNLTVPRVIIINGARLKTTGISFEKVKSLDERGDDTLVVCYRYSSRGSTCTGSGQQGGDFCNVVCAMHVVAFVYYFRT
jgi:hypothetical protein